MIYLFEVAIAKLALLFFYLRVFSFNPVKQVLWGTVVFTALFGLVFVFVTIFQCQPIEYSWIKWDGKHRGRCINLNVLAWSNSAISITLDLWMLAVPMWQLKVLKMGWRRKVGVAIMFCVGTL